jgi:predicted nucleic-acid-binding Zn-ribbon protein
MPGIARQFEPQITRTGGVPSKYRFTARCSRCHKTDTYEASTSVGDGCTDFLTRCARLMSFC